MTPWWSWYHQTHRCLPSTRYDLLEFRVEALAHPIPILWQATPTQSLSYGSFDHINSTQIDVHQPLITRRLVPYRYLHNKVRQHGSSLRSQELVVKSPPSCQCLVLTKVRTSSFGIWLWSTTFFPMLHEKCSKGKFPPPFFFYLQPQQGWLFDRFLPGFISAVKT